MFVLDVNKKLVVAIHNKNGQGLLRGKHVSLTVEPATSQSTIKMDKGYYRVRRPFDVVYTTCGRNPQ